MTTVPNTTPPQDSIPPLPTLPETTPATPLPPPIDFAALLGRWTRLVLASNPFYILSAVLVLWSMDRLSLDSRIFSSELPQLFFNVSAFQVYEALLVGTAIFLAGRKIWYDSGLLVGLENMFIAVPFILVSQVLLADKPEALFLCLAGCVLAVARIGALKRFVAGINMPGGLLAGGVLLLIVNLAVPSLFWYLHKDANFAQWDIQVGILTDFGWRYLAPLCAALAFLLPMGQSGEAVGKAMFFRRWFPLVALLLWVAGTLTHFYCIGYVYRFNLKLTCLIPALWMTAWVLWNRRLDFDLVPSWLRGHFDRLLSLAPLSIVAWAMMEGEWPLCLAMSALNAVIYGALTPKVGWSRQLGLASLALALGSVPLGWISAMGIHAGRLEVLLGAAGVLTWGITLVSRNPRMAILGTVLLPFLVSAMVPWHLIETYFVPVQMGLLFLLLHSLRWEDGKEEGASAVRLLVALLWVGNSLLWLTNHPGSGGHGTLVSALLVLGVYGVARQVLGHWGPCIVPFAAFVILSLQPLFWGAKAAGTVFKLAGQIPTGLLILGSGFGMFAIGTILALTRSRWNERK